MRALSCGGRKATASVVAVVVLGAIGLFTPSAGAVVVRTADGRLAGVTPVAGVPAAAIGGSVAATGPRKVSANGNLNYHSGPVLHASAPYLIFWDPNNEITSPDRALFERYFADAAAASGAATNVFSVNRQFTDTTGFADYSQTWSASHAISDAQAYPTSGNCTQPPAYAETTCLFNSQLQSEVTRLISAGGLPTGTAGNAPIYFVVTPPDVNSCFNAPQQTTCADNAFCAFHSSYSTGGHTVLYADIPTVLAANAPKSCQFDNQGAVQSPNANPLIDVAIKYLSHEDNETITDPLGTGWWDSNSGNENGDNCNFYGSSVNPQGGSNPNAFQPTLGGSASGTLFNQLINGDPYYTQSEWSNGDVNCEMQPTSSALSAAFTAPAMAAPSVSVTFDPSSSSSAGGYTSATWSFGDGTSSFTASGSAPTSKTHSYAAPGVYTATLTLVDRYGNLSTVSHTIDVVSLVTAAFSSAPAHQVAGSPVAFDASASSSTAGSIASYSWDFGDGSAPGSGVAPTHAYATAGTFTVTLTVTDTSSNHGIVTHSVVIDTAPTAAFGVATANPVAGSPVAFDGSGSSAPSSSIASYRWDFGDGSAAGSGVAPSHAYASAGTFTVVLTVTDANGHTATATHAVAVASPAPPPPPPPPAKGTPSAVASVAAGEPVAGVAVGFSGSQSTDRGSTIVLYLWSFGDGSTGTGPNPTHVYGGPGRYSVSLTVVDATGATSTSVTALTVGSASVMSATLRLTHRGAVVRLSVSGPGTVLLAGRKVKVTTAGIVVLRLKLTPAQLKRLHRRHLLLVKLRIKFLPGFGTPSTKVLTIKLRG